MKPIETVYRGYRFRSRLEARWAVFFDALGLRWEYEPEGFEFDDGTRYLPDFKVTYPGRWGDERHCEWFEVKGDLADVTSDEWAKMLKFHHGAYYLTVLDGVPSMRMYASVPELLQTKDIGSEEFIVPYKLKRSMLNYRRHGCALWCGKGRLWWDEHSSVFGGPYEPYSDMEFLQNAVDKARSARFEFGETPT